MQKVRNLAALQLDLQAPLSGVFLALTSTLHYRRKHCCSFAVFLTSIYHTCRPHIEAMMQTEISFWPPLVAHTRPPSLLSCIVYIISYIINACEDEFLLG